MAKLTITELTPKKCTRCSGYGVLSQFGHNKGGECFRCSGSGKSGFTESEREMTENEVFTALELFGFPIIEEEVPVLYAEGQEWMAELFGNTRTIERSAETIAAARHLLAAI